LRKSRVNARSSESLQFQPTRKTRTDSGAFGQEPRRIVALRARRAQPIARDDRRSCRRPRRCGPTRGRGSDRTASRVAITDRAVPSRPPPRPRRRTGGPRPAVLAAAGSRRRRRGRGPPIPRSGLSPAGSVTPQPRNSLR
jgi:hypothetical protein